MSSGESSPTASEVGALLPRFVAPGRVDLGSWIESPLAWPLRFIGFGPQSAKVDGDFENAWGWSPLLALNASFALCLAALATIAARRDDPWSSAYFYSAVGLMFFPLALRAVGIAVSRRERLAIALLAGASLFILKIIRAPVDFIDHDEFLHWLTAIDIMEQGRLYTANPLLPVSPEFPGLELCATALAHVSGLSIYASSLVLLGAGRIVFSAALFLVFERISGSSRIAVVASLLYAGAPTFLVFDAHFAYESLAVVFLAVVLLAHGPRESANSDEWRISVFVIAPLLFALAATHHLTSYFAAALLCAVALLGLTARGPFRLRANAVFVAAVALIIPTVWSWPLGDLTAEYLGPVFGDGVRDVSRLFSAAHARQLFVGDDGSAAPAWQRTLVEGGVGATCLGLSSGFIRALRQAGPEIERGLRLRWRSGLLIVLTLFTVAYPVSVLFRLTRSGWEIGNRLGALSILGVAPVVAIGVVHFWQGSSKSWVRATPLAALCAVIVVAGMISGEGPQILVPGRFIVSADAASIKPSGVSAAEWARLWLGPGNRFASDRINTLLLATYGRQDVTTTLQDESDASAAFVSERLEQPERQVLHSLGVQFLLVDLRLSTARPQVGVYFEGGAADHDYVTPISKSSLMKFGADAQISRPFDNGDLSIYDVRKLDDAF